jgi:hypothetical protein
MAGGKRDETGTSYLRILLNYRVLRLKIVSPPGNHLAELLNQHAFGGPVAELFLELLASSRKMRVKC